MNTIKNFGLSTQILTNNINTFSFEFDMYDDITVNIGGYELWASFDTPENFEVVYTIADSRTSQNPKTVDSTITGKTYFDFQGENTVEGKEFAGRKIYFYLVAISTLWNRALPSNMIEVYGIPTEVQNVKGVFNNYNVALSWEKPKTNNVDITKGLNSTVSSYQISRLKVQPLQSISINNDTKVITHNSFILDSLVYVHDTKYKTSWFSKVTTAGQYELSVDNIYNDIYEKNENYNAYLENLLVYVALPNITYSTLSIQQTYNYIDSSLEFGNTFFYQFQSIDSRGQKSASEFIPITTTKLAERLPILYSIANTNNSLLSQYYWRAIKEVLIDKNYYDKSYFAIPQCKGEYNFQGYIGISNAIVDIFINDILTKQIITKDSGLFEFSVPLAKGVSYLQLQIRDHKNIDFSKKTNNIKINTVSIYSFFATLGKEYNDIWTTILERKRDISLTNSNFDAFQDKIQSLYDIQKYAGEPEDAFRTVGQALYKAYNYSGYQEALNVVLESFKNVITDLDHYEVYMNNSLYDTKLTGKSFVITTSTGLSRANYYYGITAVNDLGEESGPTILRVDCRWWPVTSTGSAIQAYDYSGFNALTWSESKGINRYNVYRYIGRKDSIQPSDLDYLVTIPNNIFVDCGSITPNTTKKPPTLTFTYFNPPKTVKLIHNTKVASNLQMDRKSNWIVIVLYGKDATIIPEYQSYRLLNVLNDIIPPETGFTAIYCNDEITEIL